MKALIFGALFAMATVACVEPTPEPAPDPQTGAVEQKAEDDVGLYCVTAGPDLCIMVFPIYQGATQQCLSSCRAAGFPNARCVYFHGDSFPC